LKIPGFHSPRGIHRRINRSRIERRISGKASQGSLSGKEKDRRARRSRIPAAQAERQTRIVFGAEGGNKKKTLNTNPPTGQSANAITMIDPPAAERS